jgi:O-Antigen ligase
MNARLLITIAFVCTLLSDVIYYFAASLHINLDATTFSMIFKLTSLVCLLILDYKLKWRDTFPVWVNIFFKWLIFWNIIVIIRGGFSAETYWDWKYLFLNTGFTLLVPYAVVTGALFNYTRDLYILIITRLFVFGYIAIPLTLNVDLAREFFPRALMVTVSFFILAIPYVKTSWRIVISCVGVVSVLIALDYRTNVIRICFAFLLVSVYYLRKFIPLVLLKAGCVLLCMVPFIFLLLGITKKYDVFKPSDDIEKYEIQYDNGTEANLATDTRTFLYEEVFSSMKANGTILIGEGATGKYKTEYFEDEVGTNKGRFGAEVGFLNALLYSGCLGVLLYVLILFSAVYYGISRSNNFFCKMLAIFLAFRWIIFFIEDYIQFDMNCFFLWMAIGLCLSKGFRSLSDADVAKYFNFQIPRPQI